MVARISLGLSSVSRLPLKKSQIPILVALYKHAYSVSISEPDAGHLPGAGEPGAGTCVYLFLVFHVTCVIAVCIWLGPNVK